MVESPDFEDFEELGLYGIGEAIVPVPVSTTCVAFIGDAPRPTDVLLYEAGYITDGVGLAEGALVLMMNRRDRAALPFGLIAILDDHLQRCTCCWNRFTDLKGGW